MNSLPLETASRLVDITLEKGRELGLAPLAVALLDARGQLKCFKSEDGVSLLRADIAIAKAWGALGMGFGTRELARRAASAPQFFAALQSLSSGRVVPAPGGVLIRDDEGQLLGAIGVSGASSDDDEHCAVSAIAAMDLVADPGGTAVLNDGPSGPAR